MTVRTGKTADQSSGRDDGFRLKNLSRVYQWGSGIAGLLLSLGLILTILDPESSPSRIARGFQNLMGVPLMEAALLVLWSIPIAGLLGAAVGLLRRNRADRVGWLALILGVFLIASWFLP